MSYAGAFVLLAALLCFTALVFVAALFFFAFATGWRALARRYPARLTFEGQRYRVNGVVLGSWGWNAPPLWAGIDDVGIALRPVPPFSLAFPSVHLPWVAIVRVSHRDYRFFNVVELHYGSGERAQIGFLPSAVADRIAERLAAAN